ncbi:skin secretory protein xP2-like [Oenanthe melanoleuca]|uniref:skin secretory protein xP2-like n=1 Tax=Oenanthe melanoleuca TaxID=2939378 RepID=UPI0024C1F36E|nr:skin secretory protein xP2-like [Oenanthe melanoleuca]
MGLPSLSRAISAPALPPAAGAGSPSPRLPTHPPGPRPPLRARDRGGPGAAPARRTRARGTGRARRRRARGGPGMRVRRRGREGPAPSLVPAGAAGEPPRPRAPASFRAARSFMSAGSRQAPPAGLAPARGPRPGDRHTPAPPPARPAPAAAPWVPQRSLRLPRGPAAATPGGPTPARAPAAPSPRRRLCPCERPAAASFPPPLSPNFSRPPALTRCPQPQHHVHGSGSVSLRAERRRLNPCRAAPLPAEAGGDQVAPPGAAPAQPRPRTQNRDAPADGGEVNPLGPLRETRTSQEQTPPHRSPTQPNRQQTSTCSTAGNARAPKLIIALILNSHTLK